MSKKLWLVLAGVSVLVVVVVVGIGVAYVAVPRYRAQQHLSNAGIAAEAGRIGEAKQYYREYLYLNPTDDDVLEAYAELCVAQLSDRRSNLVDAGRAYLKLYQLDSTNTARLEQLFNFYRHHQFWEDLEAVVSRIETRGGASAATDYEKAVAIHEQGRTADAVVAFETYLADATRERHDIPLRLARILREQERVSQAVELLDSELAKAPDDLGAKSNYANYLMDDGDLEKAAAMLPASIDIANVSRDVSATEIRLRSMQADYEAVLALTKAAMEKFPDEPEFMMSHLISIERVQGSDEALSYVESLEPVVRVDAPGILMLEIELQLAAGQWEQADEARQLYLKAYPAQLATDEYLNGRIAFSRESYEDARKNFTLAVEMNPTLDRARFFLALTMLQLDDKAGAQVSLELYLRNNPEDRQARQLWSRYFDRNRSALELRTVGKRYLSEENPSIDDLQFTAQDLLASGEAEDEELAKQLVEKALELDPRSPRNYTALAGFYLEAGQVDAAESILAKAEEHGIARSEFALLDASIALGQSDKEKALEIARAALESADLTDVKAWATFFSRRGHLRTGQQLLDDYSANTSGEALFSLMLFRVELALQFDEAKTSLELLRKAEESAPATDGDLSALNRLRILVAQRLIFSGNVDLAMSGDEILNAVSESDPENGGIHILRARVALRESPPNLTEAIAQVDNIAKDSSLQNDAALVRADVAMLNGEYDKAQRYAKEVIGRSPDNKSAWYVVGDAQNRMGSVEEARTSMERVLEIDRSDSRAMRSLVMIYSAMKLDRKSEAMMSKLEDLASINTELSSEISQLRTLLDLQAGNVDEAEAGLRERIAQDPTDYTSVDTLVKSLVRNQRSDEALVLLRDYLEKESPDLPEPWVLLGQILLDQGDRSKLSEASTSFTQALVLVPGFTPAQLGNIDVQIRLGNDGVAIAMCDRYLNGRLTDGEPLNERDAQVFYKRSVMRSSNESGYAAAMTDVNSAIEIVELPQFLSLRAKIRMGLGDSDGAIEDVKRIAELVGKLSLSDEMTMAEAYLKNGDLENARHYAQSLNGKKDGLPDGLIGQIDDLNARISTELGEKE